MMKRCWMSIAKEATAAPEALAGMNLDQAVSIARYDLSVGLLRLKKPHTKQGKSVLSRISSHARLLH